MYTVIICYPNSTKPRKISAKMKKIGIAISNWSDCCVQISNFWDKFKFIFEARQINSYGRHLVPILLDAKKYLLNLGYPISDITCFDLSDYSQFSFYEQIVLFHTLIEKLLQLANAYSSSFFTLCEYSENFFAGSTIIERKSFARLCNTSTILDSYIPVELVEYICQIIDKSYLKPIIFSGEVYCLHANHNRIPNRLHTFSN